MLTRLELTNFKKHEHLVVEFSEGLNAVVGPNYRGKSSIMEAILFALWGATAVPGGSAVILKRGAERYKVVLDFEIGKDKYQLTRTVSTAVLKRNGQETARSASAVSAEVEKMLGMSRKRHMQIKYGEQGKTQALMSLGTTELHKIIEEISGVDIVNRVLEVANGIAKTKKGGLEALTEVDTEEVQRQLDVLCKNHSNSCVAYDKAVKTRDFAALS